MRALRIRAVRQIPDEWWNGREKRYNLKAIRQEWVGSRAQVMYACLCSLKQTERLACECRQQMQQAADGPHRVDHKKKNDDVEWDQPYTGCTKIKETGFNWSKTKVLILVSNINKHSG